jgi:Permeases of the drug/metabolite transporter (DMT) superfamily
MKKKARGSILLLITSLIWGTAFVTQKSGMDYIGPFTFNCIRMLIGSLVLLPFLKLGKQPGADSLLPDEKRRQTRMMIRGSLACGIFIFLGTTLQQIGLIYTTAGKAGFITALYVVIVPLSGIFMHKKIRPTLWLCVALAVIGLYLLCVKTGFRIQSGDLLMILGSFAFAMQIHAVDYYSPKLNPLMLSCMEFLICGIISLPFMLIFEQPSIGPIMSCWPQILYTGALSCGVAYTLQIIGQRNTDPTVASLLMSLESVFAAISGALFLSERMTGRELIGCVLMFTAIILAQMPPLDELKARRGKEA